MARNGRRIEFYRHERFGGNVPIYLSSKDGKFRAEFGDNHFEDPDLRPKYPRRDRTRFKPNVDSYD